MRLLDGCSRAGAVRLTGVLVAAVAAAACCVGVSSAAAGWTIHVGGHPEGVSSDGTHVWVANYAENTVSEIEASTGSVIRTIPVGRLPGGVSSDGTHVWVANSGENAVSEIEASTGSVIRTIPVGKSPSAVSSDGIHVWVANDSENTVSEILATGGKCTSNSGTVKLSPGLTGIAAVQTMKINGTLAGCAPQPFTKAKYTATLKTAGAVSCAVLTGAAKQQPRPRNTRGRRKRKPRQGP